MSQKLPQKLLAWPSQTAQANRRARQSTMTSFGAPLILPLLCWASLAMAQSAGPFAAIVEMTTPRAGHTATVLTNGQVLIAGGTADPVAGPLAKAEIYDPNGGFIPIGDMTVPRSHHTATLLPDGRVLLAGGNITPGVRLIPSNRAEIYDPSTGTFAATGNMIGNHGCQEANLLSNGKVLFVGGYDNKGGVTRAELYDPGTGTFAATGSYAKTSFDLNICQGAASAVLPDGRVLIVWQDGGAEIYDPDTALFTATGNPIHGGGTNGLPTVTSLINGKVLVAGGASDTGFGTSASLYNLSTATFTATGNMTTGRALHSASLLPDGNVLLAGAYQFGGGSLASAELYDPASGAFTPLDPMLTPRQGHTATLLDNGKVLIAGGSVFGRPTSRAELYSPKVVVPAPELFSLWHASGEIASAGNPATAGAALSMYTSDLRAGGLIPPQVTVGGRLAGVLYFGPVPGHPGYHQVNIRVPAGVAAGPAIPVRLTYLGQPSNEVTIGVR